MIISGYSSMNEKVTGELADALKDMKSSDKNDFVYSIQNLGIDFNRSIGKATEVKSARDPRLKDSNNIVIGVFTDAKFKKKNIVAYRPKVGPITNDKWRVDNSFVLNKKNKIVYVENFGDLSWSEWLKIMTSVYIITPDTIVDDSVYKNRNYYNNKILLKLLGKNNIESDNDLLIILNYYVEQMKLPPYKWNNFSLQKSEFSNSLEELDNIVIDYYKKSGLVNNLPKYNEVKEDFGNKVADEYLRRSVYQLYTIRDYSSRNRLKKNYKFENPSLKNHWLESVLFDILLDYFHKDLNQVNKIIYLRYNCPPESEYMERKIEKLRKEEEEDLEYSNKDEIKRSPLKKVKGLRYKYIETINNLFKEFSNSDHEINSTNWNKAKQVKTVDDVAKILVNYEVNSDSFKTIEHGVKFNAIFNDSGQYETLEIYYK